MANIMSQLKLKNNTSRNGFDLSRKNAFTAKVGELLPVACIECIPGDVVKGRVQHFTRTMPVNTAAYTRIREYYDWFFVPTNLLWNKFNQFVTQMTNNNQHATSITGSQVLTSQHPYFTVSQVYSFLKAAATKKNQLNFNFSDTSAKLLSYLDYGDYSNYADNNINYTANVSLNPFPLLAYQKIYADYYRNSQWENPNSPSFNIDYIDGSAASLNIPIPNIAAGSFNYSNMFSLRYSNWNKDLFMGTLPSAQYGGAASINVGGGSGTLNLNLGETTDFQTALRLRDYTGDTPLGDTALKTSTNIISSDGVSRAAVVNNISQNFFLPSNTLNNLRAALGLNSSAISGTASVTQTFSILALRQAEALQKWKEITQSQQQDYKNQIEAHFGVSMSDAYSERCRYIDGSVSSLDISEVTNTNLADNNAAEIAGKGVGVGDGSFKFSSDVHGYLMCIYHATPLLDYGIDGIPKVNTKTMVTDYAIPEFDKTGMVQVPVVELSNKLASSAASKLLGYAPRYYDYKTAVDKVRGAFVNGGLGAWVAPIDSTYISRYFGDLQGMSGVTSTWFKVNPKVLNPIFAQDAGDNVDTDQLLVNTSFDITAVRNLDRNGLPY